MKLYFMINPHAGSGKALECLSIIKQYCDDNNCEYSIFISEYKKHIEQTVRQIIQSNTKTDIAFIAVGGDGTVLEVLNGMSYCEYAIMGVIPVGTGNDFSRSMGLEPGNIEESLDVILSNNKDYMDVCEITTAKGKRAFLNVASIGFDADINKRAIKLKSLFENHNFYVFTGILTLFCYKSKKLKIKYDGKTINKTIFLCAIANGNYYAGGFRINPNGKLNDGKMDIILFEKMLSFKMLFRLSKIHKGEHLNYKNVTTIKTDSIEITSKDKVNVQVDGEPLGMVPVRVILRHNAVIILSPS